ncbi:hypothetical protein D3C86_1827450 [compost metagenome]
MSSSIRRIAASVAAIRATASPSSWAACCRSTVRPRVSSGRPTLAISREKMITPIASKITASRAGNGVLSCSASGRVRMPARVIAPRTPAVALIASRRTCGMT